MALISLFFGMLSIYAIRRHDKLWKTYELTSHTVDDLKTSIKNLELRVNFERDVQASIAKIIHNFSHAYRKLVYEIHSDLVESCYANFQERKSSFKMFILFLLTNIKEVFDILTGDQCSVCVKIIDGESVKTFMRDPISYRERSGVDRILPEFPFYENTAFKNILDFNCPPYYISNDLSSQMGYINANKDWPKYYNACIVAPVRLIMKEREDEELSILGFICVDNKKGGFNESISVNVIAVFADLCFHLFNLYYELYEIHEGNVEQGKMEKEV